MEFKFKDNHENKYKIKDKTENEYTNVFELYRSMIDYVEAHIKNKDNFIYICSCKDIFKAKKNNYNKFKNLKRKKGVYCFYEESDEDIIFWYIGECHESNETWDIRYRLKQHFQVSQDGLLSKVMKAESVTKDKSIEKLNDVKIGYFDLSSIEATCILLAESILITNCKPIYNKK